MFDDDDVVTVSFLCDQGIEATAVGTFVANVIVSSATT